MVGMLKMRPQSLNFTQIIVYKQSHHHIAASRPVPKDAKFVISKHTGSGNKFFIFVEALEVGKESYMNPWG